MKRCFARNGKVWIVLSALLCCCACSVVSEKQTAPDAVDSHTSMNALDWPGTYTGILPCADCAGIETSLTLTPARTYVLHRRYMEGKPAGEEVVRSGVFTWSLDGRSIELPGLTGERALFQVGENKLFALDQSGARIEGVLAEAYTLDRSASINAEDLTAALNVFAGTSWYLVEVQGEPLAQQEAAGWLVFETDPARVYGFSGCNRFFGAYRTGVASQPQVAAIALPLTFDAMGTTMMACPPAVMEYETEFLTMLAQVAGVYIQKNTKSEQRAKDKKIAKRQKWWEGTELVLVDSAHRVIARFSADADL